MTGSAADREEAFEPRRLDDEGYADRAVRAGPRGAVAPPGAHVPAPNNASRDRLAAADVRAAVTSDQPLLADLASAALAGVDVHTTRVDWPGLGSIRALRRRLVAFRPHVCVTLQDLDDVAGVRLAGQLLGGDPLCWVALATREPGPAWGAALEAGAYAVLPGHLTLTELVAALRQAAVREEVMDPGQRVEVVTAWQKAAERNRALSARLETLTPREVFVLEHLYDGHRVSSIAQDAGVAEATVRSQVKSVLRKLGVDSQIAAVAAYRQVVSLTPETAKERRDG